MIKRLIAYLIVGTGLGIAINQLIFRQLVALATRMPTTVLQMSTGSRWIDAGVLPTSFRKATAAVPGELIRFDTTVGLSIAAAAVAAAVGWYFYTLLHDRRAGRNELDKTERSVSDDAWVFLSIVLLACSIPILFAGFKHWPSTPQRAYRLATAFFASGIAGLYVQWRRDEFAAYGRRFEFLFAINIGAEWLVNTASE